MEPLTLRELSDHVSTLIAHVADDNELGVDRNIEHVNLWLTQLSDAVEEGLEAAFERAGYYDLP